jgi:hypothetical protein
MSETVRIANCSGFFGDRLGAAREMIDGGPVDVLTGDWLAELTMGVLLGQRLRDPERGFAHTFVTQLEDVLGDCLDHGIRVVSNAGGLNPRACARAVEQLGERLGRELRVACVEGDDVTEEVRRRLDDGWEAPHLDTGAPLSDLGGEPVVSNAYLGCWGVAAALERGADVVVTGRVSDASLIVGPAAWAFGWDRHDWDALAGAVAAGHVIECGAQATGGNYSFFTELDGLDRPGFPLAEIAADGSAVITKHPGTGGAVTTETVTAQLLYEIDGPRYRNPDVVARFDTLRLEQVGPDRVLLSGCRGEPAPAARKVGLLVQESWRNAVTFVLTGLDVEAKAELAQRALWAGLPGGRDAFDEVAVRLLRADRDDPGPVTEAVSLLTVEVADADRARVDAFSRAAVETALASYPGLYLTSPPGRASAVPVFWPTLLEADVLGSDVTVDGHGLEVAETVAPPAEAVLEDPPPLPAPAPPPTEGVRVPLGRVAGTRSGDKAGSATLGVWARDEATFDWLAATLTADRLAELLPEVRGCEVRPWWLPNLRSIGFTIVGLLGRGVAANLALDPQAKGLGEHLRARTVTLPEELVPPHHG